MQRKLVGLDLDGVIAIEDREKYFQARAGGVKSLLDYYLNIQPDREFLNQAAAHSDLFRYHIYTARKDDIPEIQRITNNWLFYWSADYPCLDLGITFTQWRWKAPELLWHGASAMVDNDISTLNLVPFIHKLAYKPYYRSPIVRNLLAVTSNNPAEIFDKLIELCYPIK